MRASDENHWKAFKTATFRLLHMIGGDSDFAPMTRVQPPALSKYKAQQESQHFIPLDVLYDAEKVAGAPVITELLCRLHGFRMVPLDSDEASPIATIDARRMNIADAISELTLSIKRAIEDGHLDELEKREIHRRGEEAIREIRQLLQGV